MVPCRTIVVALLLVMVAAGLKEPVKAESVKVPAPCATSAAPTGFLKEAACAAGYEAEGSKDGILKKLGPVCWEGNAQYNTQACGKRAAEFLNNSKSPPRGLHGCLCDDDVVKVACKKASDALLRPIGMTKDRCREQLKPTLIGFGMVC